MRHPILPLVIVCMAAALLAGCSRGTQAPATSRDAPAAPPATSSANPAPSAPVAAPPMAQGKRAAGEENAPVLAWRAMGAEPFWGVHVEGDTLVFTTPEDQTGRTMHGRRVPSPGGIVIFGTDGKTDFNLYILPGECSDGMSDNRYHYESRFLYGDKTYKGCAEAAK
ncbi:putative membrane protein [Lysobacter niabensis]|uniref:Membrane protein n=1 Tax=Agrilutibacter niabensis TaxID=380628 RepID=A0ABU1VPX3_9GAMM|nr:hypothetical protein [Lysobacter niabensis]MDR7099536.1 putative membrane protein [Lysobacter niabensis]